MNLEVMPARGGSKRIPRKNIKEFCGKPIIAWSIEAALASECFDRVVVSTDDEEIAAVAREWGAEVPFMRPQELADDYVGTAAVVRHAIEWFTVHDAAPDLVCCIYPTAPFVEANDIARGLDALLSMGSDYAISVTSFPYPIQRAVRITAEGGLEMFYPEYFNTRSQDLEEAYHDAGQFYWGLADAWGNEKSLFSRGTTPVILPSHRVQDIDTPEDWERAEIMFQLLCESLHKVG
jgi:N-acylneuraminate cytidylyltransferase